jgi:hypothetical protein
MDVNTMLSKILENPKDVGHLLRMLCTAISKNDEGMAKFLSTFRNQVGNGEFDEIIYTVWAARKLEERREACCQPKKVCPL